MNFEQRGNNDRLLDYLVLVTLAQSNPYWKENKFLIK